MFPERVCHHCLILTAGAFAHAVFRFLHSFFGSHVDGGGLPVLSFCFIYSTRLTVSDETAGLPRLSSSRSLRHQPTRSTRTDTIEQKADSSIHCPGQETLCFVQAASSSRANQPSMWADM